ncbi:MAG TPA: TIGR04053 family radical SAM/SPASM domain-containing protein [Candidatus Deferrimicrobium sp.]|nr:TIGR04053 family radical SAM/SPASM domain-containing protein [Candidatus Deferrimicrobium sp.]
MDFDQRPFTVVWETTRACDLACIHCRAEARAVRDPSELSFAEAQGLIQSVKAFGSPYPIFVLTGGDPAKRPDIFAIIEYARSEGLRVAMTPSATPLITRDAVRRFAEAGLIRLAVSLDGKDSAAHDGFRGVSGSFERTLNILDWCREFGLESQIHTTVTRHVLADLPAIAAMIAERGIKLWALFLLIAVGRAARPEIRRLNITAKEIESLFHWLYDLAKSAPFDVTPREGYHYRRVLLQRRAAELAMPVEQLLAEANARSLTPTEVVPNGKAAKILRAPLGVNDGRGVVFISHTGDVQPSGFLTLVGGNIRSQPLPDIYRSSDVFTRVRDFSQLKGKCGVCEFKSICGGSRSRAYAITGYPMGSDPYCVYQPKAMERKNSHGKSNRRGEIVVRALGA